MTRDLTYANVSWRFRSATCKALAERTAEDSRHFAYCSVPSVASTRSAVQRRIGGARLYRGLGRVVSSLPRKRFIAAAVQCRVLSSAREKNLTMILDTIHSVSCPDLTKILDGE